MSVLRRSLRGSWPLGLLLASSPALAAPSARLAYVREAGAESCPDEEGLRRAVAARLGYDPFFVWARVTVVAHVRKDAGAYHAEVTLVDEGGVSRGKRAVTSPGDDCAPLVGALALTISLALDPLSLAPAQPATEPPRPRPRPRLRLKPPLPHHRHRLLWFPRRPSRRSRPPPPPNRRGEAGSASPRWGATERRPGSPSAGPSAGSSNEALCHSASRPAPTRRPRPPCCPQDR